MDRHIVKELLRFYGWSTLFGEIFEVFKFSGEGAIARRKDNIMYRKTEKHQHTCKNKVRQKIHVISYWESESENDKNYSERLEDVTRVKK
jgi:hypothetical protein